MTELALTPSFAVRALDLRNLLSLARKEMRDSLRNRWFILYTIAFAVLALALSFLSLLGTGSVGFAGFGRTAAGLINLVILIVPLMALTAGAGAIAGERERGTLGYLLAQPVSRIEVILGKYLGLAVAMMTSLALGFGLSAAAIAWRSGGADASRFARLVVLALLLALAMLSVGFLVSVLVRRGSVATGAAIFIWLTLVFLGDLGLMGSTIVFKLQVADLFRLSLLNPLQVFKMTAAGKRQHVARRPRARGALRDTDLRRSPRSPVRRGARGLDRDSPERRDRTLRSAGGGLMRRRRLAFGLLLLLEAAGCGREDPLAPPQIYYGQDVCHECGMIISDDRFAAAAVVQRPNGAFESALFDDIGCLLTLEHGDAEPVMTVSYVRAFDGRSWLHCADAVYLHSRALKTPMAFGVAAFATPEAATVAQREHPGDLLDLGELRERFRQNELGIEPLRQRDGEGSGAVDSPDEDDSPEA